MIIPWLLSAATIYVNKNATGTNTGASWVNAYSNLQDAVTASVTGDLISVTNGIYSPISTDNKSITIQSVNGAAVTIIDGGGTDRCATLGTTGAHTNTVLNGFTLTNGFTTASGGGSFGGTLNNCTLSNNTAGTNGGGSQNGTLNNCTLSNNTAGTNGGGSMSGVLNNCIIYGNKAGSYGGGCSNFGVGAINNCLIYNNSASGAGGGVSWGGSVINCTIVNNTAGWYGAGTFNMTVINCIVWNNLVGTTVGNYNGSTINYCNTSPLPVEGDGNISVDPLFVDATNNDFRLQPGSPCINAGSNMYADKNTRDLAGNHRISGGTVDMGAYEFKKVWLANLPSHMNPMGKSLEPKWTPAQLGPIAWYKGDGNALDSSGNGYDGTWTGTEAYADGTTGQAFDFNGASSIQAPLSATEHSMSIATWAIFFDAPGPYSIVRKKHTNSVVSDNGFSIIMFIDGGYRGSGVQVFDGVKGANVYSPTVVTTNTWVHICTVIDLDSGDVTFYVNGVISDVRNSGFTGSLANQEPLRIGGGFPPGPTALEGKLDDVLIFDRALIAEEVEKLYVETLDNRGKPWWQPTPEERKLTFTYKNTYPSFLQLDASYTGPADPSKALYNTGNGWQPYTSHTIPLDSRRISFKGDWRDANGRFEYMFRNAFRTHIATMTGAFDVDSVPVNAMFFFTFAGNTYLRGGIPATLFSGIVGAPGSQMFQSCFASCGFDEPIPGGLFAGISGAPSLALFSSTFSGCNRLPGPLPANLFSGISGPGSTQTYWMLFGICTSLTGEIPVGFFGNITSYVNRTFGNTFAGCANLTGPSARTPAGVYLYDEFPSADIGTNEGPYRGATGLSDYDDIPDNWK